MIKYISLLRGINVSGQKIIRMNDLRNLYSSLGFSNVMTYIQSGNVLFCSELNDQIVLKQLIEKKIEDEFNFQVPVLILTESKLKSIIEGNPFEIPGHDLKRISVSFFYSPPNSDGLQSLEKIKLPDDKIRIEEDILYFYCPTGFGKTKLNNNFIEKKLNVTATSRNWNSTFKLWRMIKEANCEQ